jgi:hypothetical protein
MPPITGLIEMPTSTIASTPRRCPTATVSHRPLLLARRHPGSSLVLSEKTLPPASRRSAAGELATALRAHTEPAPQAVCTAGLGRQAEALGWKLAQHCSRDIFYFLFSFTFLEIGINFKNAEKIQYYSKKIWNKFLENP